MNAEGAVIKHNTKLFVFIVISVYVVLNVLGLLYHEPWRDEAQAWLVARDLDLFSIFRQVGYDATPALWHMILVPFAKTGCPYVTASIVHLIIATAAVTLFALRAPFSRTTRVLFIFSYYMAYEYSVIARNYSIGILLMFLTAAIYGSRFRRPLTYSALVFLLFNANSFCFPVAGALLTLFAWEFYRDVHRKNTGYAAIAVMCTGAFLALMQILPPADAVPQGPQYSMPGLISALNAIRAGFFATTGDPHVYATVALIIFALTLMSLASKRALFIALSSYAGLFYIFVFRHGGFRRHYGFVLAILFFALWIAEYYRNTEQALPGNRTTGALARMDLSRVALKLINCCLMISVLFCLRMHYVDYKYFYSGAGDMAKFITKNGLEDRTIAAQLGNESSALLPYLPGKKFWYAATGDYGTFIVYNEEYDRNKSVGTRELIAKATEAFPGKRDLLFLTARELKSDRTNKFRLLHETDTGRMGRETRMFGRTSRERFYLYEIVR